MSTQLSIEIFTATVTPLDVLISSLKKGIAQYEATKTDESKARLTYECMMTLINLANKGSKEAAIEMIRKLDNMDSADGLIFQISKN
ncbi:MAG: hypothetical protein [Podoviridae sp. ctrTa16]|nr:MAG: hypothetical protein [Podoviridae sp. ctrTa16]